MHFLERAVRAPRRRRTIWSLWLGAFGLAFAITTLTYLPVVLGRFTDSEALIALVLGAEGAPVCALPILAAIPLVYRLMRVDVTGRAATGP